MSSNPPFYTLTLLLLLLSSTAEINPDCPTKCGSITVPYPLGIGVGSGCSIDKLFELSCNASSTPPRLTIPTSDVEIIEIRNDTVRIKNTIASACYDPMGRVTSSTKASINLQNTPFSVSDANMLTVVGCDDIFLMLGFKGRNFTSGCASLCSNKEDLIEGECSGIGCARSNIPKGFKAFVSSINSLNDHVNISSFDPCAYGFLGDPESFVFSVSDLSDPSFLDRTRANVAMILDWEIGIDNCSVAESSGGVACRGNSVCVDSGTGLGGYRCSCLEGYQGNPYLTTGCVGNFCYFQYS